MPHRRRAGRVRRRVRGSCQCRVADARDGRPVRRARVGAAPLPRPPRARGRRHASEPRQRAGARACARATGCSNSQSPDAHWLDAIEHETAEVAIAVAAARAETVRRLAAALARDRDPASAFPWAGVALDGWVENALLEQPATDVEDRYRAVLRGNRARDAAAGRTTDGPHLTDLEVLYGPKGIAAAQASTGEQKALLIGLVLAHAGLVAEMTRLAPLLLLDEVVAHLDPRPPRRALRCPRGARHAGVDDRRRSRAIRRRRVARADVRRQPGARDDGIVIRLAAARRFGSRSRMATNSSGWRRKRSSRYERVISPRLQPCGGLGSRSRLSRPDFAFCSRRNGLALAARLGSGAAPKSTSQSPSGRVSGASRNAQIYL